VPSTFEYVKSDYAAARDASIQRLRARYPGVWNDFSTGNFGVMLLDLLAWSTSNMAYTANRLAAENFVSTMTLRESAVRLGNLTGYKLRSAAPATVPCQASLASVADSDVTLSRGTPVRTGDASALTFELDDDYTILTGQQRPLKSVATFDPFGSGSRAIQTYLALTNGGIYADADDTTVDLRQYVQVGQLLIPTGAANSYEIVSIETFPGAASYCRLVLGTPWDGTTGQTTAEVVDQRVFFVQGQTQLDQTQAPSGNTASFAIELSARPVIDASVEVSVNGVAWTEVNFLADADLDSEVYEVKTLPTGVTVVTFGDDKFGKSVPAEAVVAVNYRTGGGILGNIQAGAINTTITGLVTGLSNPLTVLISNTQPGSGGLDAETLSEARLSIPAYTRTNDRAVTLGDYQSLATGFSSSFGQVRYARALVRTQNSLLEGNVVLVYAWSAGPSGQLVTLSSPLKAALQSYLQEKALGTDYVLVADGEQQALPLSAMFKTASGYSASAVAESVRDAAASYVAGLAPGDAVVYADLFSALMVPGVGNLIFATPIRDLKPVNNIAVFSAPSSATSYPITLTSGSDNSFTGQLSIAPLAAWSFSASLAGQPLVVIPDNEPGYARLIGGPLDPDQVSVVNLSTGLVTLYAADPVSDFTVTLQTAQGYDSERVIDLYAGYTGDLSQAKRREVRNAIRAWSDGLAVGSTLFSTSVTGVRASEVNLSTVIANVAEIAAVTYTSIGAPQNSSPRLDVGETERVSVRNILLNANAD
jgi:hypothetical protein